MLPISVHQVMNRYHFHPLHIATLRPHRPLSRMTRRHGAWQNQCGPSIEQLYTLTTVVGKTKMQHALDAKTHPNLSRWGWEWVGGWMGHTIAIVVRESPLQLRIVVRVCHARCVISNTWTGARQMVPCAVALALVQWFQMTPYCRAHEHSIPPQATQPTHRPVNDRSGELFSSDCL